LSDWTDPNLLLSLLISIIGLSLMAWWLISRINLKLSEVAERKLTINADLYEIESE